MIHYLELYTLRDLCTKIENRTTAIPYLDVFILAMASSLDECFVQAFRTTWP